MSIRLLSAIAALGVILLLSIETQAAPTKILLSQQQTKSTWQERPDFSKYFQKAGVKGTFLL